MFSDLKTKSGCYVILMIYSKVLRSSNRMADDSRFFFDLRSAESVIIYAKNLDHILEWVPGVPQNRASVALFCAMTQPEGMGEQFLFVERLLEVDA